MGKECQDTEEISVLVAALAEQKQIIQAIFKSQDFSAMPAAQQQLKRMQRELRLLRYRAASAGADEPPALQSPPAAQTEVKRQRNSASGGS